MMFRLRCVNPCLRRLIHGSAANKDQLLERLQLCSAEDQVFDVVGNNKTKLTVDHVSHAVGMLWQFQKERPELLRTVDLVRTHPQFLTLRVLAENKIGLMDDFMLVDMLYAFLRYINAHNLFNDYFFEFYKLYTNIFCCFPLCRLNVEHHDSLVQQMVSEAWLRIDRYVGITFSFWSVS